jgi:hypothetical protein
LVGRNARPTRQLDALPASRLRNNRLPPKHNLFMILGLVDPESSYVKDQSRFPAL